MADFRALCAELLADYEQNRFRVELAAETRAALAQPEPEGVTLAHDAYVAFVQICKGNSDDAGTYEADEELVRRALKRLSDLDPGRPPIAAELDNNSTHK
jgi:hypothetical protein